MGTSATRTRRQAQADARREQLLAAALDLFAEKGFRGSSTRDIARAAGVTEGLIYHYFPNKIALLQAVIERYSLAYELPGLLEELRGVPAGDAFLRLGRRVFDLLSRSRKFVTMVASEAHRDPDLARALGQIAGRHFQMARQFVEERIATGELRPHDPAVSLRLFQGSLFWFFLMQQKLSPPLPPLDPETFLRGAVEILMSGIAASRECAGGSGQ